MKYSPDVCTFKGNFVGTLHYGRYPILITNTDGLVVMSSAQPRYDMTAEMTADDTGVVDTIPDRMVHLRYSACSAWWLQSEREWGGW